MGKVLIKDTTLTDIANAIRTKDGSTEKMYPREMAGKILSVPIGEKRLIPTKLYTSDDKKSKTIQGQGVLIITNFTGVRYASVDGQQLPLSMFPGSTDFKIYNSPVLMFKFEHSCVLPDDNYESSSRNSKNMAIVGTETDVLLEGNPKKIYFPNTLKGKETTIKGKGYLMFARYGITSNDKTSKTLKIDGVNLNTELYDNHPIIGYANLRLDFNESVYLSADGETYPTIVVY